jgi:aspartate/methionine/tyrosine aminotransferase
VIAFPRVLDGKAELLCQSAASEANVLLLPGSVYGDEWRDHVLIGFGRRTMNLALKHLDELLAKD